MSNSVSETSLSGDILRYARYQLRGRRGLIAAAIALGIPGLWFSWPWLVIAGIAPILIALAPCAVMCGLGLCAMKSCSSSKTGEASSCSKTQPSDQAPTSVARNKPTEGADEPMAIGSSVSRHRAFERNRVRDSSHSDQANQ